MISLVNSNAHCCSMITSPGYTLISRNVKEFGEDTTSHRVAYDWFTFQHGQFYLQDHPKVVDPQALTMRICVRGYLTARELAEKFCIT